MKFFLQSSNGTVYVHCKAGINRSAFLVMAFVCKNSGIDFKTLLNSVRRQRPIVCQNSAFMKQVEDELYGHIQSKENTGNGNNLDGNS